MGKIRIAIVGVGNCCSSLVQGIKYYENAEGEDYVPGLMHTEIGQYKIRDIQPVVAFDVDERKVGKDLSKAIFAEPNCTPKFCKDVPLLNAPVLMGNVLDGVSEHMKSDEGKGYPVFKVSDKKPVDVVEILVEKKVDVVVNYLPVGSRQATKFYAQAAIDAGCAFVNAMPCFIASDKTWADKFKAAGLPCIGDDIKSQFGATFSHRSLIQGCVDRGIKILTTKQLNYGGNTDFRNMMNPERLKDKLASKTDSIQHRIPYPLKEELYAGPGASPKQGPKGHGFVAGQGDNKTAEITVDGTGFGDVPVKVHCKIDCYDSPNSGGIVIDAVRCAKIALDRKIVGAINSASAWFFKHPLKDIPDSEARKQLEDFIRGDRMKAVILAAGKGTRINEGVKAPIPKPLYSVGEKALIEHTILNLKKGGIRDFIIVVGFMAEDIKKYLKNGAQLGVNINYIHNPDFDRELGVSVTAVRNAVQDEKFLLCMADHVIDPSVIKNLVKKLEESQNCILCVDKKLVTINDLEGATKILEKDGRIVKVGKGRGVTDYNCVDCGLFGMTPDIFRYLMMTQRDGGDTMEDTMRCAISFEPFLVMDIEDKKWIEVDTRSDLIVCERLVEEMKWE